MYRSMIIPLVSILALAVKIIFGVELGEDLQAQIVDVVSTAIFVGAAVYGVFKNHKTEEK